jgi:hypothetical protein
MDKQVKHHARVTCVTVERWQAALQTVELEQTESEQE